MHGAEHRVGARKEAHLTRLSQADRSVQLVCAADKLHNVRAIIRDDGLQQILPHTPPYDISHLDLRDADQSTADFELAAILRDRLRALTYVQGSQAINADNSKAGAATDADVIALAAKSGVMCIQIFFIRGAAAASPLLSRSTTSSWRALTGSSSPRATA